MDANPLVSVIIPAYNAQNFIGETIESVLAQTYKNLEIIVVDDGSTDRTAQVVHNYHPRVLYHYQQNSGGCAVPRNTGIGHSSGEFLCFMDADDLMVIDRIFKQVQFLIKDLSVDFVFCDYRNFNEKGPYLSSHFQECPQLWKMIEGRGELVLERACTLLACENFGSAGSLMVRKDALQYGYGFEPTLKSCEDFHLYYRLARRGSLGVLNSVGLLRRLHRNNMSSNSLVMTTERIRSRALLCSDEADSQARRCLNTQIADCLGSLARYHANGGEFLRAVRKDWEALSHDFCWSRIRMTCRNLARTLVLALGLYNHRLRKS